MASRENLTGIGFTRPLESVINTLRSLLTRLENLLVFPTRQSRVSYVRYAKSPGGRRHAGASEGLYSSIILRVSDSRPDRRDGGAEEVAKGDLGKKLDEYLTRVAPFGFSGAVLVARDGEVVLDEGYGLAIRSGGVANTPETVFSTGSITKQFTAAAIMKSRCREN